ncbi:PMT family glycosyltransferase, 4-amino-4-deoxy-L-arabinose transferase [Synechococcus sp. PCC 7502]|uniref:ArnT family glycosyltransferase n=1 Tax=Synechococcus sp. PCC 7502 TaxID=1173263 RepID=UPI00029FE26F|nr:glycosyltransferase family 39 protein [Synechococcus sp. PCC 7502]AFY72408.1 PMT family glycosyltransferase, 4-amino-4-deoxy-L-arabinose transferase [Synechococcus sp. PCC 7502]
MVNDRLVNKWAIAIIIWGLLTRLVIANFLPPGFDEAYYYNYTLYPNLSYFDHPPLVAFVTGFGVWLTGEVSQLTIRLGALVLYTGTLIFIYLTSAKLFSVKTATLTLAIATSIPFFQVGFGTLILPDSPLMFFWAASIYVAACEFFNSEDTYQPSAKLSGLGALIGLAFLGKYHALLLGFGLVGFCLFSPMHRRALVSIWSLWGLCLFLAVISPVVIWNSQHQWVSFLFQSTRAIPEVSYRLDNLLVTFLAGVGYLFPTFGFAIWWTNFKVLGQILSTSKYRIFNLRLSLDQQKQLLILAVSLPVFLIFTLMGGYRQILPSWHMPGFFGATLILGQQAAIAQDRNPKLVRNWLWGSGVTVMIILTLALSHVANGLVQKGGDGAIFGGFWAAKDDASTQLIDVKQVRQAFIDSPSLKAELAKSKYIFSNNFFVSGQLGMAIAPITKAPITCFDQDLRGFAFWESTSQWVGQDGLYIALELFEEPISKYDGYFESITPLGDIPIKRGGQIVQIFHVYRTTKLLKPYPRPYGLA